MRNIGGKTNINDLMKKEQIYFFLVLATFIVSFVSLGFSLPRCEWSNGMDYLGVIVGILAVLVTILIGLQLYNYIFARENIKQIIEEEIRKMGKDFEHVTSAHEKMLAGYDFVVTDYCNEKIADSIMMALKDLTECDNPKMRDSSIDYIMVECHKFVSDYAQDNGPRIYKDKRAEYLFILKKVEHMYMPELKKYVEDAVEVEPHEQRTVENS